MATYSNQHWLLSHIRNSFISTDETGMCETVMLSDDMPKNFLKNFQTANSVSYKQSQRKAAASGKNTAAASNMPPQNKNVDAPLQEIDFVCYPGLDLSDDEDIDMSTQSFDIQMYPEVGAHRFRSNTAQKLEKLDIAKRKAARIKTVNYNDEVQPPESSDLFVRKELGAKPKQRITTTDQSDEATTPTSNTAESISEKLSVSGVQSKLAQQLASSPKQVQNKFMEYARYDGTSQTGIQTKRINVFLSMLPERERNYPIKICVLASAKIIEVIGFVCYKASIQFPNVPLKSVRHYALYMTEDNDDMEDFPPLDNREPCSKFGFSHLTLAERRPLASVTSIDYQNNLATKSMTSEDDKANLAEAAVRAIQAIDLNGSIADTGGGGSGVGAGAAVTSGNDNLTEYEERLLNHNDMIDAPNYRTYKLNIIDKRFFKYEVTLGISGERIEIDQHKNPKFWSHKKAVTTPIDSVAYCEITERRQLKATLVIWLKSNSSSALSSTSCTSVPLSSSPGSLAAAGSNSPNSPSHYTQYASPFGFFNVSGMPMGQHVPIRFKHYDFETDVHTAEQIRNKLNCILEMRSSEIRREFLHQRERKLEKQQAKKQLKL